MLSKMLHVVERLSAVRIIADIVLTALGIVNMKMRCQIALPCECSTCFPLTTNTCYSQDVGSDMASYSSCILLVKQACTILQTPFLCSLRHSEASVVR